MTIAKISGYAAKAVGQLLEPYTYDAQKLGPTDVRVTVTHCGICYTDIHGIDNFYGISSYPFIGGHEIVGYISEVGSDVSEFKEGDRVGIGWQGSSCKKCEWCQQGEEQLCVDIIKAATWARHGGFSTSVVADSSFAYPIPDNMPAEVGAVLMCAGVSVYSPLQAYAKKDRQKIGIIGIGGLGHLAIQYAHALGYEVTVISSSEEKKEQALSFGADDFIHYKNDWSSVSKFQFTFDFLLNTAHGRVVWEPLLNILKKRGKVMMVGFPKMSFNPTDLVSHEISFTGSFIGNRSTMKEMLSFSQEHAIKPWIELMPMSQINDAIQRVKDNKARYRIVLENDIR